MMPKVCLTITYAADTLKVYSMQSVQVKVDRLKACWNTLAEHPQAAG